MQLHVNTSTFVVCLLWDAILHISIAVVILGEFVKLRKVTISFVMSVLPSVRVA